MASRTIETEIVAIGGRGDGIAEAAEGRFYVPFTVRGTCNGFTMLTI